MSRFLDSDGTLTSFPEGFEHLRGLPPRGGLISGTGTSVPHRSYQWRFMRITLVTFTGRWKLNGEFHLYGARYNENNTTGDLTQHNSSGTWTTPVGGSTKTLIEMTLASHNGSKWFGLLRTSQEMYMGGMGMIRFPNTTIWQFRHEGSDYGSWRIEPFGI